MIVVLGAGLAGLSTAWHLKARECRILEREGAVGGLARTVASNGFLFDFTGHLLHVKSDHVKKMVDDLLGPDQVHLERSAWIKYQDALVPYPFQVNTAALPIDVRLECLTKFAESLLARRRPEPGALLDPQRPLPLSFLKVKTPTGGYALSFHDWTIATFGEGFARHFFLSYNEKNFAADLRTISSDWVSWAVPKPDLEEVLRGALGFPQREFGYNPRFRYPRSGGIQRLPEAIARGVPKVETDVAVAKIDAKRKRVTLADGRTVEYSHLVATNPLPELLAMIDDLEPAVRAAAKKLRWCAVSSFNFGVEGDLGHRMHWIYYPERDLPFYRAGFPSHLTPAMAPSGMSSVCAEVAYPAASFPPPPGAEAEVEAALRRCGALPSDRRVVLRQRLDLPYAYVLFDDARRAALPPIFEALLARSIVPVGRYGAWDYLSMESTILQGKETAEYLHART